MGGGLRCFRLPVAGYAATLPLGLRRHPEPEQDHVIFAGKGHTKRPHIRRRRSAARCGGTRLAFASCRRASRFGPYARRLSPRPQPVFSLSVACISAKRRAYCSSRRIAPADLRSFLAAGAGMEPAAARCCASSPGFAPSRAISSATASARSRPSPPCAARNSPAVCRKP